MLCRNSVNYLISTLLFLFSSNTLAERDPLLNECEVQIQINLRFTLPHMGLGFLGIGATEREAYDDAFSNCESHNKRSIASEKVDCKAGEFNPDEIIRVQPKRSSRDPYCVNFTKQRASKK